MAGKTDAPTDKQMRTVYNAAENNLPGGFLEKAASWAKEL